MGVGGQRHALGPLPPGKETRYPLYRRLGGPQGRFGRMQKIMPPPGFDPRNVQSVEPLYRLSYPAHTAAWTDPMLGFPNAPDNLGGKLVIGQNLAHSWPLTPKTGNYVYL
jgi:hypothetical protein